MNFLKRLHFFKTKPRWMDLLFGLSILALVAIRFPTWQKQWQAEGQIAPEITVLTNELKPQALSFEPGRPQIIVFWATWCGPCRIELDRFNSQVQEGHLSAQDIWAVSLGEPPQTVFQAAQERKYLFQVYADPDSKSGDLYKVSATPTVVHVDQNKKISYITTGLSPLGTWRARWLMRNSKK